MSVRVAPAALAEMVDQIDVALFFADASGACAYLNTAARRLVGIDDEAGSLGRGLHEVLHGRAGEVRGCPVPGCALGPALGATDRTRGDDVIVAGGASRRIHFTATPLPGMGAVLEARPRDEGSAAEALDASEARYRFLTETIPVQIWTALPDGRLDYVTEQTASHFGMAAARLLDEGWLNVVHPDDRAGAVERWLHSLATGAPYEVEFRLKLRDGSYAAHLARAVPQYNERGHIVRWFGTNTNIDEQRAEQRKVQMLLDEVAAQLRASEAAMVTLRRENEVAAARIAQLEAGSNAS